MSAQAKTRVLTPMGTPIMTTTKATGLRLSCWTTLLAMLTLLAPRAVDAQQYGMFATGVDDDGVALAIGASDTHYEVNMTVGGTGMWISPVVARGNFCSSCGGLWFLHPGPTDEPPVGSGPLLHPLFVQSSSGTGRAFLYRTSFTIPSDGSVDPSKVRLRYLIGFDDFSRNATDTGNLTSTQHAVWVNGTAQTITHAAACNTLQTNCASTIPAGSFVAGVNTLEWRIRNDTTYYGFRIRDVVFETVCTVPADCNDGDACTADACNAGVCAYSDATSGTSCAGGVCDGAGLCEVCLDTGSGVDSECSAGLPHCVGASTARACVRCTTNDHCNDGNECTVDTCSGAGVCGNVPLPVATPCSDGFCSAAALCLACVDDSRDGSDSGCGADVPFCSSADESCGPCENSSDGSIDRGCSSSTPNCVDSGTGRVCAACVRDADCDDGNDCSEEMCSAGLCLGMLRGVGAACFGGVCDVGGVCGALAVNITGPMDGELLSSSTPTITGTATPGVVVVVTIDGEPVGSAPVDELGNWTLTTSSLSDGPHVVLATVTVDGGSADDMSDFTLDTETFVTIAGVEDDRTIVGTGEPGATVTVRIEGVDYGPVVVDPSGNWRITLPSPLAPGEHLIEARIEDGVGNTADDDYDHDVAMSPVDAGAPDAELDAGVDASPSPATRYSGGGLSCAASGGAHGDAWGWVGFGLLFASRLRRRRLPRS
jgi:hypothetical protein